MNGNTVLEHVLLLSGTYITTAGVCFCTAAFPFAVVPISTFEDRSGVGILEACGVVSGSLAFREVIHGLNAGGPVQESYGPKITGGSLSWEKTQVKNGSAR